MENIILTYNDIELYKNDIDILCDEYINSLMDPETIYKSVVFSGMLNYIYQNKLKFIIPDTYNNDYKLLNDIFYNIYLDLCTRYNICPTIIQFCTLVHIDNDNLTYIRRGIYNDGSKVNSDTLGTVKNWYSICESALLGRAVNENGIGSIFALKANYGYRDNDQIQQLESKQDNSVTAAEIVDRYRDTEKPVLPMLE